MACTGAVADFVKYLKKIKHTKGVKLKWINLKKLLKQTILGY